MSNWFKKKLQQLSDKLNADEEQSTENQPRDEAAATRKSLSGRPQPLRHRDLIISKSLKK